MSETGTQPIPHAAPQLSAEDRLEIAELFANWARYEDSGHSEGWAGLFTRDGCSTNAQGKVTRGYEELVLSSRRRWEKPESRQSIHWFGEARIEGRPDGAQACHYGVLISRTSRGYQFHQPSIRTYELRREDGRWKIAKRIIARLPVAY